MLAKGVNPNVAGGIHKKRNSDAYLGMTPLHIACYFGNYNMIKLLLDHGADIELCDGKGRNCLHYLASISFSDITRCSVQRYSFSQRAQIFPLLTCNVNQPDHSNTTPVMQLVSNNRWGDLSRVLIDLYLKAGADLTVTDKEGNTILMLAAKNKQVTAVYKILEITDKEYYNQQNLAGDTALHIALEKSYKIAYMLICMGADCKLENNSGSSVEALLNEKEYSECLHYAMKAEPVPIRQKANYIIYALDDCEPTEQDNLTFAVFMLEQLLKEIDPDMDKEVSYILDILYHALLCDSEFVILDTIHNSWIKLTEPVNDGAAITTIRDYCLCHSCHVDVIKKLMSFHIDMNEPLRKGKTPANLLAEQSVKIDFTGESEHYYSEAAKLFSVESMELCDEEGWCALHWAARQNHLKMMKVMLEKGADINITMDSETMAGRTPLHIACIYGNIEMIKLLLEYGANEYVQDVSGKTPAHYAVKEIECYIKS